MDFPFSWASSGLDIKSTAHTKVSLYKYQSFYWWCMKHTLQHKGLRSSISSISKRFHHFLLLAGFSKGQIELSWIFISQRNSGPLNIYIRICMRKCWHLHWQEQHWLKCFAFILNTFLTKKGQIFRNREFSLKCPVLSKFLVS